MGMISDGFWGILSAAQGDKVVIREPPPEDLLGKATNVLAQYPQTWYMKDILTLNDHKMLLAAAHVAINILTIQEKPELIAERGMQLGELSYPLWEPQNIYWQDAMKEEDITFSDDPETGSLPYLPTKFPYPNITSVLTPLPAEIARWENAMKDNFAAEPAAGTLWGYVHNLNASRVIDWTHRSGAFPPPKPQDPPRRRRLFTDVSPLEPLFEDEEIDAGHATEYSIFPPGPATQEQYLEWLRYSHRFSQILGYDHARWEDLQFGAIRTFGGFERRPFVTFPDE